MITKTIATAATATAPANELDNCRGVMPSQQYDFPADAEVASVQRR